MSTEDMTKDTYEVNSSTMAVLPLGEGEKPASKILETDRTFRVNMKPFQIIERSCRYFGSSYAGRKAGTYEVIKVSHKPPIMVDHSNNIFLFPHFPQLVLSAGGFPMRMFTSFARQSMTTRLSRLSTGKRWSCPYPSHLSKTRFTERHG